MFTFEQSLFLRGLYVNEIFKLKNKSLSGLTAVLLLIPKSFAFVAVVIPD